MPGENIFDWSTTAANNDTADALINWREGMARAATNDSARSMMAAIAKNRDLINGTKVTGGTPNAQTFSSGYLFASTSAIPIGLRALLKIGPGLTNTAAVTLDMDGLGGIPAKDRNGVDLAPDGLVAGSFTEFIYNGTYWAVMNVSTTRVIPQVFLSSGTYTPTPGMQFCTIECIGGGAGGGGSTGNFAGYYFGGGGGGSGGYSRSTVPTATVGASQVVTVGAGGLGSTFVTTAAGGGGGFSGVGLICFAAGGTGGDPGGYTFGAGGGGMGAVNGSGQIASRGSPGGHGEYRIAPGTTDFGKAGNGGSSIFGGGGIGALSASSSTDGQHGGAYGAGGGGASSANVGTGATGGNGWPGIVIITEFCT